jgi:predicted kinase
MSKLIFIVGLPGSGKSSYVKKINENNTFIVFDDFKDNAILNRREFTFSSSYCKLMDCLRAGKNCIITDIDFCKTSSREEAELIMTGWKLGIEIEWVFFENNPEQCVENINKRAIELIRNEDSAILKAAEYTKEYNIPRGAKILNVWTPKNIE